MLRRAGVASGGSVADVSERSALISGGGESPHPYQDPAVPREFAPESPVEGQAFRVRSFPPTEERSSGYPSGMPFLPNLSVSISTGLSEDGLKWARNAVWMKPPDPGKALEELRSQLLKGGWEEGDTAHASTFMGHVRTWSFRRGEVRRAVVLMDFGKVTQMMLFETVELGPGH